MMWQTTQIGERAVHSSFFVWDESLSFQIASVESECFLDHVRQSELTRSDNTSDARKGIKMEI